jgi:hypothetical protein
MRYHMRLSVVTENNTAKPELDKHVRTNRRHTDVMNVVSSFASTVYCVMPVKQHATDELLVKPSHRFRSPFNYHSHLLPCVECCE